MLNLSLHALEAMGFRQIAEGEEIVAAFHSIHVYEVQGFLVEGGSILSLQGEVSGAAYTVALGTSVNELVRALAISDDSFTDDEQAWATEHKCTPPYVLVHFGPSIQHSCVTGHVNDEGPSLITYDCFSPARDELCASKNKVLPSLISALTCSFGTSDHPVRFRPIGELFFGLTANNRVLYDSRSEVKASLYMSRPLPADEARAAAETAVALAERFNPKVSRFFHLALEEDDLLKRFLYFFLSIEIETHATFLSFDHSAHIASWLNSQARLCNTTTRFFEVQWERRTTLKERFVCCALCVWTHFTDADIDEFTRLKKIRDDIAHGSLAAPPAESVVAAERLAARLQWPKA